MQGSLEFLLGLLDADFPACVAWEDFEGPHGAALRTWQRLGFLDSDSGANPVPTCPVCYKGTPYKIAETYVCNRCRSEVDAKHLQLWQLDLEALLRFLASALHLSGDVEQVDESLWQLGTSRDADHPTVCFYLRGARCSERAHRRITTYRSVLVFHGKSDRPTIAGCDGPFLALREILTLTDDRLIVHPLRSEHPRGGAVRFDAATGVIVAGEMLLGRIPLGTREFWFLECLAAHVGEFLTYGDIKHYVAAKTRTRADTDEATYCQKLRSRIKLKHRVLHVDALIQSDRKGGGYRLVNVLTVESEP